MEKEENKKTLDSSEKKINIGNNRITSKKVKRDTVSVVSSVSSVSSVSKDKKDKKDKKDYGQALSQALGGNVLHSIIKFLYQNPNQNYQNLSKNLNVNYDTMIKTISRNKDYFKETQEPGKTKTFKLSLFAINFIKEKIKVWEGTQGVFLKKEERILKEKQSEEELMIESKNFINTYKKQIGEEVRKGNNSLCINFRNIASFSPILSEALLSEPLNVLRTIEVAVEETQLMKNPKVRLKNLPSTCNCLIENLREKHLNKLVMIEARAVSLSNIRPVIKKIKFECPSCGTIISKLQTGDSLKDPSRCSCGRKGGFNVISKDLVNAAGVIFEDLQEKTTNPNLQRIKGWIEGDLTNPKIIPIFNPGNELKIVGLLKEVAQITRKGITSRSLGFVFEILFAELFEPEIDISNFSKEDINKIEELSRKINAKGLIEITPSFCPTVVGLNHLKEAIILQMCNRKNNPSKEIRNKSNILLIGDPGTAKSVLGKFMTSINPESREVSGGGSSAVGITASVEREDESMGGYRVVPGALILAKDILFIDELNNLSEDDKPKLQEAMSEQVVRINKASIHATLRITAGILATANPKYGSFKPTSTYITQFNIPEPIINRFDLIFTVEDIYDENRDEMIADRMIERERENIEAEYDKKFLKMFFSYIKNTKEPIIDDNIKDLITQVYVAIRKEKRLVDDLIVNPRTMESLIRLVIASAKIRLSNYIEEKDIERSLKILEKSYLETSPYTNLNISKDDQFKIIPEGELEGGER